MLLFSKILSRSVKLSSLVFFNLVFLHKTYYDFPSCILLATFWSSCPTRLFISIVTIRYGLYRFNWLLLHFNLWDLDMVVIVCARERLIGTCRWFVRISIRTINNLNRWKVQSMQYTQRDINDEPFATREHLNNFY